MSHIHVAQQAQQKKADGLPDPNKREGPVKTAQDIYEENGLGVIFCIIPCCNVPGTGMSPGMPEKLCCGPQLLHLLCMLLCQMALSFAFIFCSPSLQGSKLLLMLSGNPNTCYSGSASLPAC